MWRGARQLCAGSLQPVARVATCALPRRPSIALPHSPRCDSSFRITNPCSDPTPNLTAQMVDSSKVFYYRLLWTAGDVCPEILDCAVQEKMGTGEAVFPDEENACKITGLPGWGYNPSVVAAPKWLRERAKWQLGLSDKVAFVATSRVKASNKPVACLNPKVVDWDIRRRANATASDLVLLDAHWNILFSMPIRGGHCEDNPESVQDARLFLAGGTEAGNETIFVTYPNPDPNTTLTTTSQFSYSAPT